MKNTTWNKSSAWVKKARTTEFAGKLPEGVESVVIAQTKSTWSRAKQCKLGEDTATLVVTKTDGTVERTPLSRDIYEAKRQAVELLGCAPKPTSPKELSPEQVAEEDLVYHVDGVAYGYCYCCGRAGLKVSEHGALSYHGFRRPGWGSTYGGCYGSHKTPKKTLSVALNTCRDEESRLANWLAGDLIEQLTKKLRWELERDRARMSQWRRSDIERDLAKLSAGDTGPTKSFRAELESQRRANASLLEVLAGIAAKHGLA